MDDNIFVICSDDYNEQLNSAKDLSVDIIDEKHGYRLNIKKPNMVFKEFNSETGHSFKISVYGRLDEIDKLYEYLSNKGDFECNKIVINGLDRTTDGGEWTETVIKEYTMYNMIHFIKCTIESPTLANITFSISAK